MGEIIAASLAANLAASAAILLVMVLRRPVRAAFGPRLGYVFWAVVPLAAAASLAPPRSAEILPAPPIAPAALIDAVEASLAIAWAAPAEGTPAGLPLASLVVVCWLLGVAVAAAWIGRSQSRFARALARGEAGPAVVGVLRPAIVLPSDFEQRFDRRERAVILAHETVHLRRQDVRVNALVALTRCLCWFNPLVHLAAHLLRIDQELACDAVVVERHPQSKAAYAQALLKAQLTVRPAPLGCHWPPAGEHPLVERIAMLTAAAPSAGRRASGAMLIGLLAAAGGYAAWAAAPAALPGAAAPLKYIEQALAAAPAPLPTPRPASAPTVKAALTAPVRPEPGPRPLIPETIRVSGTIVRFELAASPNGAVWVYGRGVRADGTDLPQKLWRLNGVIAQTSGSSEPALTARGVDPLSHVCAPDCAPSPTEISAALSDRPGQYLTNAVLEAE